MRQTRLFDNQGFGRPIVSRSFLIPADWDVVGGVQWNSNLDPQLPAYFESFSAASPDRSVSFHILPNYSWNWHTDPNFRSMLQQSGIAQAPPLDATGVVQQYIIPNYRPGAVITAVTPRQDLAQIVRSQLRQAGLDHLEASGCRVHLDFIEARIQYTSNGIQFQEAVVVQLMKTEFADPFGNIDLQAFQASSMYMFKAPAAKWNFYEPIFATAMQSMRQNPAWLKAIGQFHRNIARINSQGAQRRQQIMADMYEDISRTTQESWEHRQESYDRIAREFSEYMRDVETYHDPGTGFDVELPNTYEYAYSNGLGEYIITNDPLYNPNEDLINGTWQTLQAVR
jgi:hypothetical protein